MCGGARVPVDNIIENTVYMISYEVHIYIYGGVLVLDAAEKPHVYMRYSEAQ